MNENKTYEAGAQGLPGITVKIHMLRDAGRDHGKLAGFASVNLGGVFAVNSIRIYNTERGLYVAMPSKKGPDDKYHDICCPTTKEMRLALKAAVLDAYQKEIQQARDSGLDVGNEEMEGPESQAVSERLEWEVPWDNTGMEADHGDRAPESMDSHPERAPETSREESPFHTRSGADERERGEMDAMREQPGQSEKKPSIREQLARAAQQAQKPPAQEQQQQQRQQQEAR